MIPLGLGVDLVSISRIKRLHSIYGERFLNRVFTTEEVSYAFSKRNPYPSLAGSFAVKEAFYKAVKGYSPFRFKEISLIRDPSTGEPSLKLSGMAEKIFYNMGGKKICLSITHELEYTIAIVHIFGE